VAYLKVVSWYSAWEMRKTRRTSFRIVVKAGTLPPVSKCGLPQRDMSLLLLAPCNVLKFRSRDSSVVQRWATDWMIGVRVPVGTAHFSLLHPVQTGAGAHPASYPMGTGSLSLVIKRPGREANHSPPASAGVNNAWIYTSTFPVRLHGMVLSLKKAQGQLYL
jgi:hypothetical protein